MGNDAQRFAGMRILVLVPLRPLVVWHHGAYFDPAERVNC